MPSTMQINYSKCPLKKRPVYFTFDESDLKDEPENLCIKKEEIHHNDNKYDLISEQIQVKKELNNNDTIISNKQQQMMITDDYDDKISSTSVIVPTPQYPKLNMQPWNFHIPYTSEFYRNITTQHQQPHPHPHHHHHHHHHLQPVHHHSYQHHLHQQQISPLRGDLHSPSTPSEGSISPPPHYLHGRPNSVSPPIREQLYHPIIGAKQNSHIIKPEVIPSHRFLPYQIPYQPYAFSLNQPSPISPTYSESSSYYSIRSQTPESLCSAAPEDLSIKQSTSLPLSPSSLSSSSSSSLSSSSSSSLVANFIKTDLKLSKGDSTKEKSSSSSSSSSTSSSSSSSSSPPRYQCPDCNKSYSTFSGLTKHQQFHCPAAEGNQVKKSFSCKDCEKTYFSLGALKMHIRTHTLPCKCTICGKAFSRPWLLQGHIRTHTGEKPFSCQHCHRAFADRSNLRAHLQTHSDIKKYSCTTCSKTFSRMSLLTKHNEGGCPGINGSTSPPYIPSSSYQEHSNH